MRLNRYLAQAAGLSRRGADVAITEGRVGVDGRPAKLGDQIAEGQVVTLDDKAVSLQQVRTLMLNKPVGTVSSRRQQGNTPTIYSLLPPDLHDLKPIGRLDKNSSGLLVLTNDGQLAQRLTHPRYAKLKFYLVETKPQLTKEHRALIGSSGVQLADGISRFRVSAAAGGRWLVELTEGRNRQIRRTFQALGYDITMLHRVELDSLELGDLAPKKWRWLSAAEVSALYQVRNT